MYQVFLFLFISTASKIALQRTWLVSFSFCYIATFLLHWLPVTCGHDQNTGMLNTGQCIINKRKRWGSKPGSTIRTWEQGLWKLSTNVLFGWENPFEKLPAGPECLSVFGWAPCQSFYRHSLMPLHSAPSQSAQKEKHGWNPHAPSRARLFS